MKFKLLLEYAGTHYHGWQIQPNGLSIQEILQDCCQRLFRQEIQVFGAGRTDAGVHAIGQVAAFSVETRHSCGTIKRALNFFLPQDIVVRDVEMVADDFHPRFSAQAKVYRYRILNRQERSCFYASSALFCSRPIDVPAMQRAVEYFVGEHNFSAFASNAKRPWEDKNRHIYRISADREGEFIDIMVEGESFLYKMVRAMAGALLQVGLGKQPPEWVERLLQCEDRAQGPKVLPAHGLTLMSVVY